jgi:hypothetical protein
MAARFERAASRVAGGGDQQGAQHAFAVEGCELVAPAF